MHKQRKNRELSISTGFPVFMVTVGSRTECVQLLLSNAAARRMWVHLRVHIHMGSPN